MNSSFGYLDFKLQDLLLDLSWRVHPSHCTQGASWSQSSLMQYDSSSLQAKLSDWEWREKVNYSVYQRKQEHKWYTYSWPRIFSGTLLLGDRQILGNCVFFSISITSEFLLRSSPSFSPEAKWLQTKQKLVWCKDKLTDIQPCSKKFQLLLACVYILRQEKQIDASPCCQGSPWFLDQHKKSLNGLQKGQVLFLTKQWQKFQPSVC